MASADPSFVYLAEPQARPPSPSAPSAGRARHLDLLKLILNFLIALILCAILIVLIVTSRSSNSVDTRASNEKIAELQRQSDENIARSQQESTENLTRIMQKLQSQAEDQRLQHHENFLREQREADRKIEAEHRKEDLSLAAKTLQQQLEIEQRRVQMLLDDRHIADEHRREDLSHDNAAALMAFTEKVLSAKEPLKDSILKLKIELLLRRFDPVHKSLLIDFLYKQTYLNAARSDGAPLSLSGANLKELDLDNVNPDSEHVAVRLDYAQLFLPSTTLSNASFQQINLQRANFRASNLMGALFRGSDVSQTDFSHAALTLSNFQSANAYQSDFSIVKMQRATFQNANLSRARLIESDLSGSNFQEVTATEVAFTGSELSEAQFQNAQLAHARMNSITARSANFYNMRAEQADFSSGYFPNCGFVWANLNGASFRRSYVSGSNFDNTDVQNVDFTNAIMLGASITPGQLNVALSIANAILPDGSRGKNQNLVNNSHAVCENVNDQTPHWNSNGDVFTVAAQGGANCVFQARQVNATLQQRVDIRRYAALIQREPSRIYIEMQASTPSGGLNASDPIVYMNVRSFNSDNTENEPEQSTLSSTQLVADSMFTALLSCPPTTTALHLTLVFKQVNATADDIYVTIE